MNVADVLASSPPAGRVPRPSFFVLHEMISTQRLRNPVLLIQPFTEIDHLAAIGTEGADTFGEKFCLPTASRTFDDGGFSHERDKTRDAYSRNSASIA